MEARSDSFIVIIRKKTVTLMRRVRDTSYKISEFVWREPYLRYEEALGLSAH